MTSITIYIWNKENWNSKHIITIINTPDFWCTRSSSPDIHLRYLNRILYHLLRLRFLRFFPLVTWGCISPAQILWFCRPIQCQNVQCSRLYKTTKSKSFFLNFVSSLFSFCFLYISVLLPILCLYYFWCSSTFYLYLFHI